VGGAVLEGLGWVFEGWGGCWRVGQGGRLAGGGFENWGWLRVDAEGLCVLKGRLDGGREEIIVGV